MIDKLFVYGTLKGTKNSQEQKGTIKGKLYNVGWFPMVLDNDPKNEYDVHGIVMTLDDIEKQLPNMDSYEGCRGNPPLYHRKIKDVTLESGEVVTAYVYIGNPDGGKGHDCTPENLIESGVWERK